MSEPSNFSSLVESLGAIVWEADPDTFQFLFVSTYAEAILGYPVRQWIDEPDFWRRHTHPGDVQWCTEFCLDSVRNGRDHQFEYRMIAADGHVVWLRDVVTVERSANGETRMRGFMTDITDRKTAEEALRAREQQLQLAFEVASMGMAEHDHALNRTTFSDNLVRVLGFEPGTVDATYQWLLTRIHPDDRAQAEQAYAALMASEPVGDLHYRIVRPDGGIRWLLVRNRLFSNERGQPVRTVGVAMDVTARKELEDQFRQMQKMEALGQLAGGVAHDFNNLLTVIEGYGQMLHDEWPGQEQGRLDLAEILRASERAKVLTHQLLAFSRKQVVRPTRIDLNATIRDLSRMLARVIGENIELDLQLDVVPPVIADVGQIEQVVMNLAVNARDAMPFGGRLTIRTARAAMDTSAARARGLDPGEYAALVVSDTGSGMTADVRHRIFEPFFTTKEVGKGTGLGLSTVYGIVKQSSGHIEVSSEPGKGTTFRVHLPRGAGNARGGGAGTAEPDARRGDGAARGRRADGPRPGIARAPQPRLSRARGVQCDRGAPGGSRARRQGRSALDRCRDAWAARPGAGGETRDGHARPPRALRVRVRRRLGRAARRGGRHQLSGQAVQRRGPGCAGP